MIIETVLNTVLVLESHGRLSTAVNIRNGTLGTHCLDYVPPELLWWTSKVDVGSMAGSSVTVVLRGCKDDSMPALVLAPDTVLLHGCVVIFLPPVVNASFTLIPAWVVVLACVTAVLRNSAVVSMPPAVNVRVSPVLLD